MIAIKKCGGLSVVQDPNEAEYPEMPLSVLNNVTVDHSLPLAQIGYVLFNYMQNKELTNRPIPPEVLAEAEISEKVATGIDVVEHFGPQTVYGCPDCGGGLWEIKENGHRRYRCHIGHAYSELDLLIKEQENIEKSLWIALRMMEERKHLLNRLSSESTNKGLLTVAKDHKKRADELQGHIEILKSILFKTKVN
jgi:two-component system chemotaxis response regulator CheB